MTPNERKVLELAKQSLIIEADRFVCHAIKHAGQMLGMDEEAKHLRSYVNSQLGGLNTLYDWQCNNGFRDRDYEKRQQDRIDWVRWMLGELE